MFLEKFTRSQLSHTAAFIAAAAVVAPSVQAAPHPLIDSTGTAKTVVATQVVTSALTQTDATNIVNNTNSTNSVTSIGIPEGYTQIVVPMGPRYLGNADSGLAGASYYYSLNYPTALLNGGQASNGLGAGGIGTACGGAAALRVVVIGYRGVESEGGVASAPRRTTTSASLKARARRCRGPLARSSSRSAPLT